MPGTSYCVCTCYLLGNILMFFFVLYAYLCVCVTGKDRKGGMPRERLYRPIPENFVINTATFTMTSVVMEKSACNIPGGIDECWKYPTPWMHLSKMQ